MSGRAGAVTVALSLAAVRLHPAAFPSPHLSHIQASRISMACEYAIELYGPDASALPRLAEQAFDEVDRIDRLMSHYKAGSPLSQINRDAADHPVRVDSELFEFIAESMRYNRESWGRIRHHRRSADEGVGILRRRRADAIRRRACCRTPARRSVPRDARSGREDDQV